MLLKFNIFLIIIFSLIIFSGQSIFLSIYNYDYWRILQFLLFSFVTLQLFFLKNKLEILKFKILFILACIICLLSTIQSIQPLLSILDLIWNILFFTTLYILALQCSLNSNLARQATQIISLTPLMSIGFLPLAVTSQIQGFDINWHQAFPNYRMLDDAVLPCLFFLWYWQYDTSNKKLKILMYLPTTLYVLSFLLDGARANLLAIIVALISIMFLYKEKFRLVLAPVITLIVAIFIYICISFNGVSQVGSSLDRYSSSGRVELWEKALVIWLDNPVLGVGGANFVTNPPMLFYAHPHNIILQWLSEWGLVGAVLTVGLCILSYKIICMRRIIPAFILGFFIAFLVNVLLSGTMVYPLSQTLNLWGIALVGSYLQKEDRLLPITPKPLSIGMGAFLLSFIWIIIYIVCTQQIEISEVERFAPRLWLDGTTPFL